MLVENTTARSYLQINLKYGFYLTIWLKYGEIKAKIAMKGY